MTALAWVLCILAGPLALVVDALIDEDKRAAVAHRWSSTNVHTCEFGNHCGRLMCAEPQRLMDAGERARAEGLNWKLPAPTGLPARPWMSARNGGSGLRSGGKIGIGPRTGGYRARESVNPRTIRGGTAVRPAAQGQSARALIAHVKDAKQAARAAQNGGIDLLEWSGVSHMSKAELVALDREPIPRSPEPVAVKS